MTRRGADRQSVCYYVTSLHQPCVSSVFVQVRLQAVLLMCGIIIIITITNTMLYVAQNLYYVIPDLIMPNCSCIRLSTLQSQHQTCRHSSTNQTLATFTFNILTFISTIYISKQYYHSPAWPAQPPHQGDTRIKFSCNLCPFSTSIQTNLYAHCPCQKMS